MGEPKLYGEEEAAALELGPTATVSVLPGDGDCFYKAIALGFSSVGLSVAAHLFGEV